MTEERKTSVETEQVLLLQGVSKSYDNVVALNQVTLEVGEGEFVGLSGPSGAGKSTLLYLAAGLLAPDEGEIQVAGSPVSKLSGSQKTRFRKETIGMVFQDARLIPYLDIEANILAAGGEKSRAEYLIDALGLKGRAGHVPGKLSAGEQQRVGLARALVQRPKLVLADEPTGNLDDVSAAAVVSGLREFVNERGAVLAVTHDPRVLERCDRIVTLDKGGIQS